MDPFLEEFVVVDVALGDAESVGDFVELLLVAAADGDEVEVGVRLVDGDELGAEPQSHDRRVEHDVLAHHGNSVFRVVRAKILKGSGWIAIR